MNWRIGRCATVCWVDMGGRWIGFADGRVIAAGSSPVAILHAAEATGLHPFVICIGKEDEPSRIRRFAFSYDTAYAGESLPMIQAEFRQASGSAGLAFESFPTPGLMRAFCLGRTVKPFGFLRRRACKA